MKTRDLPDPVKWIGRPSRRIALLTLTAFIFSQILPVQALADGEELPRWLLREEGGWLSADQAKTLHRADQELLAFLNSLQSTQQRIVTRSESGVEALHVDGSLLVGRDAQENLLFTPTFDDTQQIQNGTLVRADGTLQIFQSGRLTRQVDALGTETFFRIDSRADYEIAPDGIRTDYSYSFSEEGSLLGATRTTHFPNGDLIQEYDASGKLARVSTPDGRVLSYIGGRLSSATVGGTPYSYSEETLSDGRILVHLPEETSPEIDLPRRILYGPEGDVQEVLQADDTTVRFTQGLPSETIAADGTVSQLSFEEQNGVLRGLTSTRSGVARQYDAAGSLKTLSTSDGSLLTLTDETLQALKLPDGTVVQEGVFNEQSELVSGTVLLPDQRTIRYADGQPVEAHLPDGSTVLYSAGQPARLTTSSGLTYSLEHRMDQPGWQADLFLTADLSTSPDTLTQLIYSEAWELQEATRADGAVLVYGVIASPEGTQQSRLSTLTQADGLVISYAYDEAGRLASTVAAPPGAMQPVIRTEYAYDRMREVWRSDPLAAATALRQTYADGTVAEYERLPADDSVAGIDWRLVRILLPDGTTVTDLPSDLSVDETSLRQMVADGTAQLTLPDYSEPDPVLTATEAVQTLADGTRLHYTRADPSDPWRMDTLTLPNGARVTNPNKPAYDLTAWNGAGQSPGRIGNAAQMTNPNRTTQQILTTADNPDLSMGDVDFTVSAWIYFDTVPAEDQAVILGKGTAWTGAGAEYMLRYNPSNHRFEWIVGNNAGRRVISSDSFGSVSAGTWYHLTAWHDSAQDVIGLQVNGGTADLGGWSSGSYDSPDSFVIGRELDLNYSFFTGRIDEVAVWRRVLTAQERTELSNGTSAGSFAEALAAYYPMEESSGTRRDAASFSSLAAQALLPADEATLRSLVESGTVELSGAGGEPPDPYKTATAAMRTLSDGTIAHYQPVDSGAARTWRLVRLDHPDGTVSVDFTNADYSSVIRQALLPSDPDSLRQKFSEGSLEITAGAEISAELLYEYSYEFSPDGAETTVIRDVATQLTKRYRDGLLLSQTDPDGAVTTYDYTSDPAGYSDPLASAVQLKQTLPGGSIALYEKNDQGTWQLARMILPDGSQISDFSAGSASHLADRNGVSASIGKVNGGAQFSAANRQYLSIEDNEELSMGDLDFTLSAWMKIDAVPEGAGQMFVLGKGNAWQSAATIEYVLRYNITNNRMEFLIGNNVVSTTLGNVMEGPLTQTWYLVTGWYDSAEHRLHLQINNNPDESTASQGSHDGSDPFVIGRELVHDSGYWNGQIDEVGVWKRVLSNTERADLYNAGAGNGFRRDRYAFDVDSGGALTDRLVAYYDLDEAGGARSDSADFSSLAAGAVLPADAASLRRMLQTGVLEAVSPPSALPSILSSPPSVLSRATVTYQGKTREEFTYRYEGLSPQGTVPLLTYVTDSTGTIRAYDTDQRLVSIEQPDGTLYAVSYARDLSAAQQEQLARLPAGSPEALEILSNPNGAEVITHRLAGSDFQPDTIVEQEFDAAGNLLSRGQANGQVTLFENGRPTETLDAAGRLASTFLYDAEGRLVKITLHAARRELADQIASSRAELARKQAEALENLAIQQGAVISNLQSQVNQSRGQLQNQLTELGHKLNDTEAMKAKGKGGRSAKSQALDQIRGAINQVRDALSSLDAQYAQALGNLESQVESVRAQIQTESDQVFTEIASKEVEFTHQILRQEISTLVISAYRAGIGRDPSEQETQAEVDRLYTLYGADPAAQIDLNELSQRITTLPDYAARADQVALLKQQVSTWLTNYVSLRRSEAAEAISILGLSATDVVSLSQSDAEKILAWLNTRSLHFGHSAFLALQEFLSAQSIQTDLASLAVQAILQDILTGVITPKTTGDLEISLATLGRIARTNGASAFAASVSFNDLKLLLTADNLQLTASPVIAHVNGNHYIVVLSVAEDGTVTYREPNAGATGQMLTMTQAEFQNIWQGVVLSARAPPKAWQALTEQEAQKITGSFFSLLLKIGIFALFHNQIANLLENIATWINDYVSNTFPFLAPALNTLASFLRGDFKEGLKQYWKLTVQAALEAAAIAVSFLIAGPPGAVAYMTSRRVSGILLDAGVDPETARIAGTVTGAIAGNFDPVHPIASTLSATAQVATQTALVKNDVDPALASLAGIGVGTVTSSLTSGVNIYDPATGALKDHLTGLNALGYTLSTQLAPTLAGELAFYGIQRLGESIGLDPTLSQLAGIPIRTGVTAFTRTGSLASSTFTAMGQGLREGVTLLAIDVAGQEAGLDPLLTSLASRTITRAIEGAYSKQGLFQGIASAYSNFTERLFATGSVDDNPVARATYLAKINDFSQTIQQHGLATALEIYATSVFQRDAVESIWRQGGIADFITSRAQVIDDGTGTLVKRIFVGDSTTITVSLDEKNLLGIERNGVIQKGTFKLDPITGAFGLTDGTVDYVDASGNRIRMSIQSGSLREAYVKQDQNLWLRLSVTASSTLAFRDGYLVSGVLEDEVTGLRMSFQDGDLLQVSRRSDGQLLPPEEGLRVLRENWVTTFSSGICNEQPCTSSQVMVDSIKLLEQMLQADGGRVHIADTVVFKNDTGPIGAVSGVLQVAGEALLPISINKEELKQDLRNVWLSMTPEERATAHVNGVYYSGSGQAALEAINELAKEEGITFRFQNFILVGSPHLITPGLSGLNIKNLHVFKGTKDWLGDLRLNFNPNFRPTIHIREFEGFEHSGTNGYFSEQNRAITVRAIRDALLLGDE